MTVSPQGFKRNIRNHSTPLNVNATGSTNGTPFSKRRNIRNRSTPLNVNAAGNSNGTPSSNRRKGRKRKLVESSHDIIDLTPKKLKLLSSNDTINDSDVEIVEPEPPTVIVIEDETDNCNELINVNPPADNVTNLEENQDARSSSNATTENKDIAISVDSIECTLTEIPPETPKAIETNLINESESFYIRDAIGGGSLEPPLYDVVSDDSFCFESTSATPVSSQELSFSKRTLVADVDDSVIFVSETVKPPMRIPKADDFIPINNRGYNRVVSNNLQNFPYVEGYKRCHRFHSY